MSDAEIIVVGAGVCGSVFTRAARDAGLNVTHIATKEAPHSAAAAAVIRAAYLPRELRHTVNETLTAYGDAVTASTALVTNYRTPAAPPKHQDDWHLINPLRPITTPDIYAEATAAHGRTLHTTHGTFTAARALVLATGATSHLSPPGTITWGVTWIGLLDALTHPDRLRVHHWAPYKSITAGPAQGVARVGASTGATPETARAHADKLLAAAVDARLAADPTAFTPRLGARLKTTHTLHNPAPGQYWVGGHHRNGYALAHHDAQRLLAEVAA